MAGNFTYSYVFQKNIAYAVSRANFLTYLTAMVLGKGLSYRIKYRGTNFVHAKGLKLY